MTADSEINFGVGSKINSEIAQENRSAFSPDVLLNGVVFVVCYFILCFTPLWVYYVIIKYFLI